MRAATRTSRFGLLFTSLSMLLGIAAGIATGTAVGYPGTYPAASGGWSATSTPSMHDDRHDWLRVSLVVRHAPAETQSDTWWAECPRADGGPPRQRRFHLGGPAGAATTATASVPWSSRAPPSA